MFFNPFFRMPRRPPGKPEQHRTSRPEPEQKNDPKISLSSELSFLLALTLKDGLCKNTVFDLLNSIVPHVDKNDRTAISHILKLGEITDDFKRRTDIYSFRPVNTGSRTFTGTDRHLSLLRVLKKYAGQDANAVFSRMEKTLLMQTDMTRMINRINNLKHINMDKPDDFLSAFEMFMPPDERKNISNLANMMRLFAGMKDKNMADIFKKML